MRSTRRILELAAHLISQRGLNTGEQFVDANTGALDICAAVYMAAEAYALPDRLQIPTEFYTDEVASIRLIEASAPAMAAIRAISEALDTSVCETEIEPGTYVPDYIDHVSNWAATASPFAPKRPPTVSEAIGRIRRTADALAPQTSAA